MAFIATMTWTGGPTVSSAAPGPGTVDIPIRVSQNAGFGTYKATLSIGIGSLRPLRVAFDTGSVGLRVFADAHLDAPGSGVQCSQTPTSVTYGNPGRITYSGVICYAPLHFENYTTPATVPIAYLTSASCPQTNPNCTIPNLNNPHDMGGGYGVFGAGIIGAMSGEGKVPNPFVTLPGALGSVFSIRLTPQNGDLILGAQAPADAVRFPLTPARSPDRKWDFGQACIFVDGRPIDDCLSISFDTGNGIPWLHNVANPSLPVDDAFVTPGTRIGFGPPGASTEVVSLTAGATFPNRVRVLNNGGLPLTNVSIRVFLNRTVTYDYANGAISFSPPDESAAP